MLDMSASYVSDHATQLGCRKAANSCCNLPSQVLFMMVHGYSFVNRGAEHKLSAVSHIKLKLKGKATPQPDSNTPAPTTSATTLAKVASLELTASEAPRETAPTTEKNPVVKLPAEQDAHCMLFAHANMTAPPAGQRQSLHTFARITKAANAAVAGHVKRAGVYL